MINRHQSKLLAQDHKNQVARGRIAKNKRAVSSVAKAKAATRH